MTSTPNHMSRMGSSEPRGYGSNSEARKRQARRESMPAHLTISEYDGKADCSVCKIGVTAPPSFGGIPRSDMLAAFIVQHAVHTKAGRPSGFTATGRATNAARAALGGVL